MFPVSRTLPRFNDFNAVNRFTSACGAIVYRDDLLGPGFDGNSFVSEPVHNLVHREIMSRDGVRFVSRRAPDEQQSEFLASSDNWFRPTMLRTGPDGALWIADMYRAVIEHPEYIPADWRERLNLWAGDKMGRIYRVYPVGAHPRPVPRLDRLDTAGLVAALDSPNGWQRDMVQQMLVWRDDKAAIPLLKNLAAGSSRALARLHALCTLDGLGALDEHVLVAALADKEGGVRRHAVRLAEPWLARASAVADAALKLIADPDAQVRLQLAYSLGEWSDRRAGQALGEMAVANTNDPYISAAIISSVGRDQLPGVVEAVLARIAGKEHPADLLQKLLTLSTALDDDRSLVRLLTAVAESRDGNFDDWQLTALGGLLDTLDRRNSSLTKFRRDAEDDLKSGLARLAPMFAYARATVRNDDAPIAARIASLGLLGRGLDRQQADLDLLAGLLTPRSSVELQSATVAALSRLDEPRVPGLLLAGWKSYGADLRGQVLDVLLRREAWIAALIGRGGKRPRRIGRDRRLAPTAPRRIPRRGHPQARRKAACRGPRHEPEGSHRPVRPSTGNRQRQSRTGQGAIQETLLGLPSPRGRGHGRRPRPGRAYR